MTMSFSRQFNLKRSSGLRARCGFTVVEVMAGVSIIALVAGVVIFGLSQLNYYASVNRLFTAAQTLAQNQIDLILTKAPFNPSSSQYPTPNVLGAASDCNPTYTYYSDPSTPNTLYSSSRSVPVYYYTSGASQVNVVMGTIKTDVTAPSLTVGGTSLTMRQATVTVTYTFRNKTFTVKMDTMRTSDI
jgi:prepilin-type N-terminal cleavage/methylation domain-containing protein